MTRIIAVLLVAGFALVACAALPRAEGAELPKKSKIKAAQQPAAPQYEPPPYAPPVDEIGWKAHNWYMGLVGGYALGPRESELPDTWHGGIVGGYLWRSGATGLAAGIEADYVIRDLGRFQLDDGVTSLRGRAGVFVTPKTFVYGTAGVAQATPAFVPDGLRKGPVVGGGIEFYSPNPIPLRHVVKVIDVSPCGDKHR